MISDEAYEKIAEFKKQYKGMEFGAVGGGFVYQFLPTGIGTFGTIIGPDGKKCEFQDAD